MSFSFIHAADLHLDSPFTGISAISPGIADVLRSSTFEAYSALIDLCIEKRVHFLLLAGDIYDSAEKSLRAHFKFRDGLKRLSDHSIKAFVVHGNHDPYKDQIQSITWPEGIHIFDHRKVDNVTLEIDAKPAALISGISHGKKNITSNLTGKFKKSESDLFHIGLLHCNVGGETGHEPYSPCSLEDLIQLNFDYWALGHVHQKKVLREDPPVIYPGNIQGRNIREEAERGCYLVEVDDSNQVSHLEFHELDVIRWFQETISIDGFETMNQLETEISEYLDNISLSANNRGAICRIILTGQGPLFSELSQENALDTLLEYLNESNEIRDPFIHVQDIKSYCDPEIDLDKRREKPDFLGQVLKIGQVISESNDMADRIRKEGLNELFQNRRLSKVLDDLTDDEIRDMLKAAEILCYQILENESG